MLKNIGKHYQIIVSPGDFGCDGLDGSSPYMTEPSFSYSRRLIIQLDTVTCSDNSLSNQPATEHTGSTTDIESLVKPTKAT